MEQEDLPLALSRIADSWAEKHLQGVPDWGPLERTLPPEWWDGFMWMGRDTEKGEPIELYKHGITRRYLNLDQTGRSYVFTGKRYKRVDLGEATEWSTKRSKQRASRERLPTTMSSSLPRTACSPKRVGR